MAYYLSKRNKKLLEPYLKLLESRRKTTSFTVSHPATFHNLLRSAFNTSHPHLRALYSLRSTETQVICEYTDIQISLDIDNIVTHPVDVFRIAEDILSNNIPIKYLETILSPQDIESLQALTPHIKYNPPILEITNG